jgi:Na+/proline symporter
MYYFFAILLTLPLLASAGDVENIGDAQQLAIELLSWLNYFLWFLAIAAFMWGIVRFIANANDPEEREKGKTLMVWGIIAFLVLLSLWAIVSFILVDTFGIVSIDVPYITADGTTVLE